MKIKMVQRKNPQKKSEVKYYASPVNAGKKNLRDIAHDIAGRSSLTRGDIENVLSNFMDCLITSAMALVCSWASLAPCA